VRARVLACALLFVLPLVGCGQAAGRILHPAEGCCEDNSSQGPFVARFLAHGLDQDFGGDGVVGTGQPSAKVALQTDGTIVTATGQRYSRTGELDPAFRADIADSTFAGGVAALSHGRFAVASLVRAQMRAFVLQVFANDGREMLRNLTTFAPAREYGTAAVLDVLAAPRAIYVFGRYSPDPRGLYALPLPVRSPRPA
jgi:hypothetical protein